MCVRQGERLSSTGVKMITDNRLPICDCIRNSRDWDFVVKYIECWLKIRMIINAVFEFLANDRNCADSRES